jgi:hypothetical protein
MSKRAQFKYRNTDELAQAIVSLACLIKDEAWVAEHREASHTTTLERLQGCARLSMENHNPETFVHQVLAYIADASPSGKPKLTIVHSP